MTLATILTVIATGLLGYAVFESKGRSATAWAFFLIAMALFVLPLLIR